MVNQKASLVLLLTTFTAFVSGVACQSSNDQGSGTGGAGGAAGKDAATTGLGGSGGSGGSSRPADAGARDTAKSPDAGAVVDTGPPPPDASQLAAYTFDKDIDGWHTTIYGSTPVGMNVPENLANTATLSVDPKGDFAGKATSGGLKGVVLFKTENEQIDFQAFSQGEPRYDWTGYVLKANVKLASGGNINPACPITAALYVSQSPDFNTTLSTPVPLPVGKWVSMQYDMAEAGIDVTRVNQMGLQMFTNTGCPLPPDAGAPPPRRGGGGGGGRGNAAPAPDAGTDGPVLPITETTATFLIDDVTAGPP